MASPGDGTTTVGGGTAISGGGTPDTGCGTPFRPVPAEFNHWSQHGAGSDIAGIANARYSSSIHRRAKR